MIKKRSLLNIFSFDLFLKSAREERVDSEGGGWRRFFKGDDDAVKISGSVK